uniref:Glyoxysomal processing protease, glyoxysomal n=2 Tax=Kalanchoe fedtschenkoi TaxID=63787 RepID=A0A7N0R992_KALFE
MGLPEVVEFGRNFAVMVRVQGPDPKGLKMRRHAFHQYNSGRTTLSASGVLLPASFFDVDMARKCFGGGDVSVVVTVASVVEHFLSVRYRQGVYQVRPELIPGGQIDVMVEGMSKIISDHENGDKVTRQWFPAKVLTMIDVPQSSVALQSVFDVSLSSSENGWEVGWSLASSSNASQNDSDGNYKAQHGLIDGVNLSDSSAMFVVLGFSSSTCEDLPDITVSESEKRGDLLLAMGSPFGVLSPMHFLNSIAVGSISNFYPHGSCKKSLLMADIRCLPGMEGGPVFNKKGELIGITTRPARQKSSGAEVQVVIPWEAMAASSNGLLCKEPHADGCKDDYSTISLRLSGKNCQPNSQSFDRPNIGTSEDGHIDFIPPSPVDYAATSVCLITVNDGAWASGVLLNKEGLVLTNAHLLEPWRFGKTTVTGGRDGDLTESHIVNKNSGASYQQGGTGRESHSILPETSNVIDSPLSDNNIRYRLQSNGYRSIRVRLGQQHPWIWSEARVVHVSTGPLDVALLQLEYIPDQLCPISVESFCPSPGSKAYVIGHGLFGPRSGSAPSINLGLVAKVVRAKINPSNSSMGAKQLEDMPVMLETTATVHPGCSGGAVVNSLGCMIGLVTSNSRHGGGTVIPHLNFSIPCAAMEPIFEFSKDMGNLSLLQDLDKSNSQLSSIWSLAPPVSPKTEPSLPKLPLELPNKDTRGSRFAKFIAERADVSKISTDPDQLAKAPDEKIQSKL